MKELKAGQKVKDLSGCIGEVIQVVSPVHPEVKVSFGQGHEYWLQVDKLTPVTNIELLRYHSACLRDIAISVGRFDPLHDKIQEIAGNLYNITID